MHRLIDKDPAEDVPHEIDWREFLVEGDTVDESVWTSTPPGLTITAQDTGQTTTCVVSGGMAGMEYIITCTVTISSGKSTYIRERSSLLKVRNL